MTLEINNLIFIDITAASPMNLNSTRQVSNSIEVVALTLGRYRSRLENEGFLSNVLHAVENLKHKRCSEYDVHVPDCIGNFQSCPRSFLSYSVWSSERSYLTAQSREKSFAKGGLFLGSSMHERGVPGNMYDPILIEDDDDRDFLSDVVVPSDDCGAANYTTIQEFDESLPPKSSEIFFEDYQTELWVTLPCASQLRETFDTRHYKAYVLLIRIQCKKEDECRFKAALLFRQTLALKEPGCITYRVHTKVHDLAAESLSMNDFYMIYAVFATKGALLAHLSSSYYVLNQNSLLVVDERPQVTVWRRTDFPKCREQNSEIIQDI